MANDGLAEFVETNDEWVRKCTGIRGYQAGNWLICDTKDFGET